MAGLLSQVFFSSLPVLRSVFNGGGGLVQLGFDDEELDLQVSSEMDGLCEALLARAAGSNERAAAEVYHSTTLPIFLIVI
jgi:hypothetical protein